MNLTQTTVATALLAVSSTAFAGAVVELAPSQVSGTLTGLDNLMFPEIRGAIIGESLTNFEVSANVQGFDSGDSAGTTLYQGSLMTRIVRSHQTGMLTVNFMLTDPNESLDGSISHIEISGFSDFQTRVEFRNDAGGPGDEGPVNASRSETGDTIDFSFGANLQTEEETNFFFVMLDTAEFDTGNSLVTVHLQSGETVSFNLGAVPTPGSLGLLSIAGLITARRRR